MLGRRSLSNVNRVCKLSIKCFSQQAGNVEPTLLPGLSPDQIRKIGEMDNKLRNRHVKIAPDIKQTPEEYDIVRRKRMIYRSKQRGWLEVDILLGKWATEHVPTLTASELDEYDAVLKEETINVYNYLSGKDPLPIHLQNNSVVKKIQKYALSKETTFWKAF